MLQRSLLFLLLAGLPARICSQDQEYAKAIISKLSSPEFKGRGYVEGGDRIAARYISEEFNRFGLLPLNEKSFYQEFRISVNTFPGRVSVKLNDNELVAGSDFLIGSSSPSIRGIYPVVKTTRSQVSDSQLTDLEKAAGTFLLIDNRGRENEKPEIAKERDEYIDFLKYDPLARIAGVIIYADEKLTWDISARQSVRPVVTISKEMDLSLINSIELIIESRYMQDYKTMNVAGKLSGNSDSMIVLLAHYDHLGKMGRETYFPGANDNSSGVAMLLNLAKYFAGEKPEYTMVFVALSAEEAGLLGAKAFTEDPPLDLKKIKFLINFDLAGTGDEGIKVVNGSIYKDKFDLLTKINNEKGLLPAVEVRGPACNSDHCLFYRKGVPCFYIYTLGGIRAYHDIYDRPETLPLTKFTGYCTLMIEFIRALSF